ncbi:hypothetical protein D5086_030438 [Populus alba]|uniref:Uncharacterized protein n=1 Tax=Populus alba TaxID=43335 RepID=A0ACC4APG0_POPAL
MHACDAGTVSSVVPSDSEDTNNPLSSDSISFESPPRLVDLAVSFQVFLDLTEMEMIKAKKASRLEAEKRRMELEAELTRMMLQTQLQIASIVAGKGTTVRSFRPIELERASYRTYVDESKDKSRLLEWQKKLDEEHGCRKRWIRQISARSHLF